MAERVRRPRIPQMGFSAIVRWPGSSRCRSRSTPAYLADISALTYRTSPAFPPSTALCSRFPQLFCGSPLTSSSGLLPSGRTWHLARIFGPTFGLFPFSPSSLLRFDSPSTSSGSRWPVFGFPALALPVLWSAHFLSKLFFTSSLFSFRWNPTSHWGTSLRLSFCSYSFWSFCSELF